MLGDSRASAEDLASAESQSVHDPDEFLTPDSDDEGSTDVSNPYRQASWTDTAPQPTEPEDNPEAEPEEEWPISAFQDSTPRPLNILTAKPS